MISPTVTPTLRNTLFTTIPSAGGFRGLLDQYGGAAAAYSLRALSSGWLAGDVVEVRPSSGWTPASFTAGQVANGEMVDYVKRPGNFTNVGFETFANNGTGDGFTAINSTSIGFSSSYSISGVSSDVVTIDFDIDITTGSPALALRVGTGSAGSNVELITTSGSKSIILTATGNYDNFSFSDGDVPSEFTISNVRVSTNDGFVTTWYDQSGNANNATQATTTAQPKIVDAGALVVGGIYFDGVDDALSVGSAVISSSSLFGAAVCQHRTGSSASAEGIWGQYEGSTAGRFHLTANSSSLYSFFANATDPAVLVAGALGTAQTLLTVNLNGSTGEIWRDGATQNTDAYSGFTPYAGAFFVGKGEAGSDYFNGAITELIVYNSDQESNQPGIDAEIIANYGI